MGWSTTSIATKKPARLAGVNAAGDQAAPAVPEECDHHEHEAPSADGAHQTLDLRAAHREDENPVQSGGYPRVLVLLAVERLDESHVGEGLGHAAHRVGEGVEGLAVDLAQTNAVHHEEREGGDEENEHDRGQSDVQIGGEADAAPEKENVRQELHHVVRQHGLELADVVAEVAREVPGAVAVEVGDRQPLKMGE